MRGENEGGGEKEKVGEAEEEGWRKMLERGGEDEVNR